jgi:tetraacyldisaccharide 4'-kinase
MNKLRLIFLPFSWIYGLVLSIRNFLYNNGILKSESISIPSICVGNLSMGGTGKTPHVDFITSHFLSKGLKPAILSRGYGRKTTGIIEVKANSSTSNVGDEPLFYKTKFKESTVVYVAENRVLGAKEIVAKYPKTELLILDDAFQHRRFKAKVQLIITDFSHLFSNDFVVPAGNLREFRCGRNRADIIVVSKCPADLASDKKIEIRSSLNFKNDNVYFSRIKYDALVPFKSDKNHTANKAIVVTGIGNPTSLIAELNRDFVVKHVKYPDHHPFSAQDIEEIHEKIDIFAPDGDGIIITTEKDFMRLREMKEVQESKYQWFYKTISIEIDEQEKFNLLLEKYVNEI